MLAPFRWLLRSLTGAPKSRRAVRRRSGGIETLESRLLLTRFSPRGSKDRGLEQGGRRSPVRAGSGMTTQREHILVPGAVSLLI
jgi:hypothetical protein